MGKRGVGFCKIQGLLKSYCLLSNWNASHFCLFPRLVSYSAESSIKNCFLIISLLNLSFVINDKDLFLTQGMVCFSFSFKGRSDRGVGKSPESDPHFMNNGYFLTYFLILTSDKCLMVSSEDQTSNFSQRKIYI